MNDPELSWCTVGLGVPCPGLFEHGGVSGGADRAMDVMLVFLSETASDTGGGGGSESWRL